MEAAPIALFAYKKLDVLKKTIEALSNNYLARQSDLIIFSDNAKGEKDSEAVEHVRMFLDSVSGFRSVLIYKAERNKGLAKSIIEGVSKVFEKYDKIIVLEDDIVTTPNFLNFMNEALEYYSNHNSIFSVSGFTTPVNVRPNYSSDVYFTHRSYSWGWATWKNRWSKIDWSLDESVLNNKLYNKLIEKSGSDLKRMLKEKKAGKIDSWAVIWCTNQAIQGTLSVFPVKSKVVNIGFNNDATHTSQRFNRFHTFLDTQIQKTIFKFEDSPTVEKYIERQFFEPFSFRKRLIYKLLNFVMK